MKHKHMAINRHHMIQQCERDFYNVNDPRNIHRMLEVKHTALHQLFRNLTTPKDQLSYLKDMFEPILSEQAKELLVELLEMTNEEFYGNGLVR